MKVILLQDVAKIGRRSQLVEVPDGYALNKLIPSGLAEAATPINLKRNQKLQADKAQGQESELAKFTELVAALRQTTVKIAMEVNEKGHAFKAVSEKDMAEAAKAAGIGLEATMVKIASPIKEVGEHQLELVLGTNKAYFTIEVVKK